MTLRCVYTGVCPYTRARVVVEVVVNFDITCITCKSEIKMAALDKWLLTNVSNYSSTCGITLTYGYKKGVSLSGHVMSPHAN